MRPTRYLSAYKGFNAGSGSRILRKAQRTTIVQRVFSSNCPAVEPSHLKNAATVSNARRISVESACVEVRWIVRLRPLSTIRPMIDMYAGREVVASRWAVGSARRQNAFHQFVVADGLDVDVPRLPEQNRENRSADDVALRAGVVARVTLFVNTEHRFA